MAYERGASPKPRETNDSSSIFTCTRVDWTLYIEEQYGLSDLYDSALVLIFRIWKVECRAEKLVGL